MARQRRGGFRPPEIRGTLGTLLRTTLEQASVVRDAIERSAREGRSRLDEALAARRRKDALAELGALVLDLIRRGEIDLGELPEAQELVRFLDDLDADDADEPDDRVAQAPTRRRFDARSQERSRDAEGEGDGDGTVSATRGAGAGAGSSGGSAGSAGSGRSAGSAGSASSRSGDGTVSATRGASSGAGSGRWSPPKPAAPQRVWRPSLVDDEPPSEPHDAHPSAAPGKGKDKGKARTKAKGGIQFDDDEDLAAYMHPDDVPPKPPADGDR